MNNILQALTNPQAFVNNVMQNNQVMSNPMVQNACKLYQSGDVNGLKSLAENIAKEKGTSIDAIRKQLNI